MKIILSAVLIISSVSVFAADPSKKCSVILSKKNGTTELLFSDNMGYLQETLFYKNFKGLEGEKLPSVIVDVKETPNKLTIKLIDIITGAESHTNVSTVGRAKKIEAFLQANSKYNVFNDPKNYRVTVECE